MGLGKRSISVLVCRSTPIFDDVAGLPSRLLSELPACFRAAAAVFGVRYDNVAISAHAAATAAQTDMARPAVVAFGRWLLQRFGVTPTLTSEPTPDAADGEHFLPASQLLNSKT